MSAAATDRLVPGFGDRDRFRVMAPDQQASSRMRPGSVPSRDRADQASADSIVAMPDAGPQVVRARRFLGRWGMPIHSAGDALTRLVPAEAAQAEHPGQVTTMEVIERSDSLVYEGPRSTVRLILTSREWTGSCG